jgi:threonyl-tRNA synthetase
MKGYPKYIATKQDFINLLADPGYIVQALEDLKLIRDLDDDKASRTISINEETGEATTEEIDNPMPLWKVKGFSSRQEVEDLISEVEND